MFSLSLFTLFFLKHKTITACLRVFFRLFYSFQADIEHLMVPQTMENNNRRRWRQQPVKSVQDKKQLKEEGEREKEKERKKEQNRPNEGTVKLNTIPTPNTVNTVHSKHTSFLKKWFLFPFLSCSSSFFPLPPPFAFPLLCFFLCLCFLHLWFVRSCCVCARVCVYLCDMLKPVNRW